MRNRYARVIKTTAKAQITALALMALISMPAKTWAGEPVRIVAFGDSLIAGYGLRIGDAFPDQLQRALERTGENVEIINAGVSGDTAAAAEVRLDWALPPDADGAILLLGGNDALRGQSPRKMKKSLDRIITKMRDRKLQVLLFGMKAPRNTGKAYYQAFDGAFPALARKHDLLFDPFFLEGVALDRNLNQIDGLHPNAEGVAKIVDRVLPLVRTLIKRIKEQQSKNQKS